MVPVHSKQCVPCIQQGTHGSGAITIGGSEAASGPYFHTPLAKQTAANSLGRRQAELQETQLRCFRDLYSTQAVTMVVRKEPPHSPAARESTLQAHLCTKHSLTNAWTLSPLLKKPNNFLSKVGLRLETHGRYPC